MHLDPVALHVLWRETSNRIEVLQGRVNEGVDVDAASEFVRWLRFSGILKLLESAPNDDRLPCHGKLLAQQVATLTYDCGQWYAHHERANTKPPAQVPKSELEKITAQLNALTVGVARLQGNDVSPLPSESFHVIEGGGS